MKTILVPVDFSEITEKLIEHASRLATGFDSKVWLIHITLPHPDLKQDADTVYPQSMRDAMAKIYHHEHEMIQKYASNLREKGIEATALLIQGDIVETVLEKESELNADLIVLGSHGHSALHNMLLGSVSEGVLKRANCPLYIVHSKTRI